MPTPPDIEPVVVHVRDRREDIERLEHDIIETIEGLGFPDSSAFAVKLAFEEAITNAFEHGHADLPGEPVTVEYAASRDHLWITIEDKGPGFRPDGVPDPTLDENLDKPSGRGLMLMKSFMAEVSHNARGNRVELRYDRPDASNGQ